MAIPPKRTKQEASQGPGTVVKGVTVPLEFRALTHSAFLVDNEGEVHSIDLRDVNAIAPLFSFPGGYTALQGVVFRLTGLMYWDEEIEQEAATGVRDSFLRQIWLRRLREKHLASQPIPF